VIDEALARVRRDKQHRNPSARPPAIYHRRGDVIIPATEVVIGDDNSRVFPGRRVLYLFDEVSGVLLATQHRRVSGVFVVLAYRFDKRDLW
jgi:hypothetical protein